MCINTLSTVTVLYIIVQSLSIIIFKKIRPAAVKVHSEAGLVYFLKIIIYITEYSQKNNGIVINEIRCVITTIFEPNSTSPPYF